MRLWRRAAAAALLCAAGAVSAAAQQDNAADRLSEEARLRAEEAAEFERRASAINDEARAADERIANLAADAAAKEAELAQLRANLASLRAREAEVQETLRRSSEYYGATLNAMVALSKTPEAALFAHSGRPLDMARSWALMSDLDVILQNRSLELQRTAQEIDALRREGLAARGAAETAIENLRAEERQLQTLISERRAQTEDALALAANSQRAAEELRGRIDEIGRIARSAPRPILRGDRRPNRPPPPPENPFSPIEPLATPGGQMIPPVTGNVLIPFGGSLPEGGALEGVLFQTSARARVFAPWGGRVVYSGPLQNFGLVVAIDAGENTQIVLAGLGNTHMRQGDQVLRGDVVGRLGGPRPLEGGRGPGPSVASLYLEMRRGGRPVNPRPWLGRE